MVMHCRCKLALNWRIVRIENLAVIFKKLLQYMLSWQILWIFIG